MTTITKKSVIAFYIEYFNNFLTIERMASYYDMPEDDCRYLVDLGRKYHLESTSKLILSDNMKVIDVPKESILTTPF